MSDRDLQRDAQLAATPEAAFDAQIDGRLKQLHTCIPGIIASFDPAKQTASVQPAIKRIFNEQGAVNLPLCVDVPVAFPGGGDFFLTFPVKAGDECILLFSERAIDLWYQGGGTQEPSEYRLHDLSDGLAIVGLNSQPRKIPSFNSTDTEFRNRTGTTKVQIKPDGTIKTQNATGSTELTPAGKFIINAPGGLEVNAPTTQINSATTNATGTVNATGAITGTGGMAISGGSGASVNGNLSITGSLTNNGKNVGSTHTHSGVQAGAGNTGAPN